jgi:hypothetical protein
VVKSPGPDLAGALAAMRRSPARGRGRKSPVYLWLAARHDPLAAAFAREAPSWAALARYLGEGGVTGSDGLPPTAASVRSAWLRVVEATARRRARAAAKGQAPAAPEAATAGPAHDGDDDPPGPEPAPPSFTFLKDKK